MGFCEGVDPDVESVEYEHAHGHCLVGSPRIATYAMRNALAYESCGPGGKRMAVSDGTPRRGAAQPAAVGPAWYGGLKVFQSCRSAKHLGKNNLVF